MRRYMSIIALAGAVILLLTACSPINVQGGNDAVSTGSLSDNSGSNSTAGSVETTDGSKAASGSAAANTPAREATPENTDGTQTGTAATTETAVGADIAGQDAAVAEPVDTGITLETVRKAAIDAGFVPEDIQDGLQQRTGPNPVRGIYINYKDDSLQSQCPVYEFNSPAEALEYARRVNSEGYSLCIVNGKLVGMTGSKYGVVWNDKEKATLEKFLECSFMTYEEPAPQQVSANKDYAGACTRMDAIVKAVDRLVNKPVLVYQKSLPADDPGRNIASISFSMLSSADMAFTSILCEDRAKMDQVVETWEVYGCTEVKLKHDAANDYVLTGKRAGMEDPFNIHCAYSPDKDSLRILDINGAEKVELLEFVPLGGDKYAFQTLYERGIVGYRDGKVTSFIYSLRPRTKETAYDPDADSIYPVGSGVDESWVSKLGEDAYEQFITYDGTRLKISATDFTGNKIKIEIGV